MLDPDEQTIVIVEVKTRSTGHHPPEEDIGSSKHRHLLRIAGHLHRRGAYADRPIRFDAVAIHWPPGNRPQVRHHRGAFESPF